MPIHLLERALALLLFASVLTACGAKALICSAGTVESNGQCVLRCGAGTVESDGGQCVTACPSGTVPGAGGQCTAVCPSGTVAADAGQCVPVCPTGTVPSSGRCAPTAGSACTMAGFDCQDGSTALECRAALWVGLPCRGPGGCARAGATIECDMSRNLEGDRCASTAEGKGLCTADRLSTLECRNGVLVKTNTCRDCIETAGQIECMP